jgi:hypothetical protein
LQIKTKIVSCHTADFKPVKQEVNGTVILPPLVFPGWSNSPHVRLWILVDFGQNFLDLNSALKKAVPVCQLLPDGQPFRNFRLQVLPEDLLIAAGFVIFIVINIALLSTVKKLLFRIQ